jgi:hypothetical protein
MNKSEVLWYILLSIVSKQMSDHLKEQQITWTIIIKDKRKDEQEESKKGQTSWPMCCKKNERIYRLILKLASYSIRNDDIETSNCCYE